ncbi:MAG: hypothetical protein Q9O62_14785 [Ardenticatenia bacterium]|nr:hypothetical protein [Ardenticatenia bacterium]
MTSLRTWWHRLVREFPTHPVSKGISQWLNAVHSPDDLGMVCGQLNETEGDWVVESLGALWYPLSLDWRDLCVPSLLFSAWSWPRSSSLDTLLSRRGFRWQPVTAEYDLNADGILDPIGTVTGPCVTCTTGTRTLWAFLSADQQYLPLLATSGQPPGGPMAPLGLAAGEIPQPM